MRKVKINDNQGQSVEVDIDKFTELKESYIDCSKLSYSEKAIIL